jgi:hypothetical protein
MLVYKILHILYLPSLSNYVLEGVKSKGDSVISYDIWSLSFGPVVITLCFI